MKNLMKIIKWQKKADINKKKNTKKNKFKKKYFIFSILKIQIKRIKINKNPIYN